LISSSDGRFPRTWPQPPRRARERLLLHRYASFVANKLCNHNLLPAGSSAHAPATSLSVQKTSAISAGVAVFHSNQPEEPCAKRQL